MLILSQELWRGPQLGKEPGSPAQGGYEHGAGPQGSEASSPEPSEPRGPGSSLRGTCKSLSPLPPGSSSHPPPCVNSVVPDRTGNAVATSGTCGRVWRQYGLSQLGQVGRGVADTWYLTDEARDAAAGSPTVHRQAPTTRNSPQMATVLRLRKPGLVDLKSCEIFHT